MAVDFLDLITEAERVLGEGDARRAAVLLRRVRRLAGRHESATVELQADVGRYREILARTLDVTLARGVRPVGDQLLDGVIGIVGARRGTLARVLPDGSWRVIAARDADGADLPTPEQQLSRSIVGEAISSAAPVVTHDAGEDFAGQASVGRLSLRSVACLPLVRSYRVEGFIYLDNADQSGLFDEAAMAAVQAWLPVLGQSLGRALDAEQAPVEGLPGVVTRSARMRAELQELGRVARFDVSVVLTGETGTGKSFIARKLHQASGRSAGPFVHVNCGAIPESLIEGELFGAEAGAYTGATTRRLGRFEAAQGGTLFLDELDTMPLACQVKLLVALQERRIQRLGGSRPVPVDVRVVAAMGSEPDAAIAEGRLREDLFYRLAVFVAHLPPLRQRSEDVPLYARRMLAEAAERYGLPPLHLTEAAVQQLVQHDWPGNVRELGNVLDRSALLARDGEIAEIRFQGRRRAGDAGGGAGGTLPRLHEAARALLDQMDQRPDLRRIETADAFRSIVLLGAIARAGGREAAFSWLGLDSQVRNRNHNRVIRREQDRLEALAAALAEPVPDGLVPGD